MFTETTAIYPGELKTLLKALNQEQTLRMFNEVLEDCDTAISEIEDHASLNGIDHTDTSTYDADINNLRRNFHRYYFTNKHLLSVYLELAFDLRNAIQATLFHAITDTDV